MGARPVRRRHRRSRLAPVATGVLALTGTGLVGAGVAAQDPAPPAPPTPELTTTSRHDPQPVTSTPSAAHTDSDEATPLGFSRPVSVAIPAIDVRSPVVRLGQTDDRRLEVPSDPAKTGWYRGSAAPGAVGPSVIVGHVTWDQEPTVFFRLGELRPGQHVHVQRADGRTAIFEVTKLAQYPKDEFPTERVYGDTDRPELRLITCAGRYDADSNNYEANIIVYADLVATRT